MARSIWVCLAGLLLATCSFGADLLQKDDLVAICGDSITEQKQYSVMIESYLTMCRGEPLRVVTFGWGGDSLGWLFSRGGLEHILALHPTVVSTCYGMNDGGYAPAEPRTLAKYQEGMTRLVDDLRQGGVRMVVVGSPGAVDSDSFRNSSEQAAMYNATLGALRDVAREVAADAEMPFADVHETMMNVMPRAKGRYGREYHLAGTDGVHPAANGQLVMAYAFLRAMGFDGEIGIFRIDMATGRAEVSEGHKLISASKSEMTIESKRYPFCFFGNHSDPNATTGVIEFVPFNSHLNRMLLVVENAAPQTRVTWGDESRDFTAEQLAEGINLAKQFASDTPFDGAFQKVETAIRKKQQYETTLYKGLLANYAEMRAALVEEDAAAADSLAEIREAMLRRDDRLSEVIRSSVVPITHTIKLEAVQ